MPRPRMLDRKYSPAELAAIAARASDSMGDVPDVVVLAAHVAAADLLMTQVAECGPLPPDFQNAAAALRACARLFLLVCDTGPVGGRSH